MKGRAVVVLFAVAAWCVTGVAQADTAGQTPGTDLLAVPGVVSMDAPSGAPAWGVTSRYAYVIPGFVFNNLRDAQHARGGSNYIYNEGTGWPYYDATIFLPTGALIDGVTTYYNDADVTNNVNFYFYRLSGTSGSGFTSTLLFQDASSGSGGYQGGYDALSHTVYNYDTQTGMYLMVVNIDPSGTATNLSFGGALVWYSLQVSPAPVAATFGDVPVGAFGFQHIEALAASGITGGCGGGNFCPNDPLTRAQMAVFLSKALGLHWED